ENERIVPNNDTIISQLFNPSQSAQRRSYEDDSNESSQSLFKSLIPKSAFKKPIKKIFRSWFEPDPEALDDESTSSTYYFARPKSNPFQAIRNRKNHPIHDSSINTQSTIKTRQVPAASNYVNRVTKYANHDQQQQYNAAQSPYNKA
ncbi:hypothetical protein BLA29_012439, partial [Euroglyphus maynei]